MIITIGREFGSGGREIGKRLADALNLKYFDKEIITEIAKGSALNEQYVENVIEKGFPGGFYYTFGQTFAHVPVFTENAMMSVLAEQRKVIMRLAETDCVIVGRSADAILTELKPFRLFVYADEEHKIKRCRDRAPEGEKYTDKQLIKKMKSIDKGRKKLHSVLSPIPWGDKRGYDLMINTGSADIEKLVPLVAEYIKRYYESK